MHTTIIYAHPYEKSLNHGILTAVRQQLDAQNQTYQLIDLYQDEFNPVYTKAELALFSKGEALDPLVLKYREILTDTNRIIFIFPIWWYDVPAIVKGFFDKMFLKTFSYHESEAGLLKGHLTHIKEAYVLTTSAGPTWFLKLLGGNAIQKVVLNNTFKAVGIGNVRRKWFNIPVGKVAKSTPQKREKALKNIQSLLS